MLFDNRVLLQGFMVKTIIWKLPPLFTKSCVAQLLLMSGELLLLFPTLFFLDWLAKCVGWVHDAMLSWCGWKRGRSGPTQSLYSADAIFGHVNITCLATSADSVAVMLAKVAAASLDSVLQWCWAVSQHSRHFGTIVFTLAGGPITRQ